MHKLWRRTWLAPDGCHKSGRSASSRNGPKCYRATVSKIITD